MFTFTDEHGLRVDLHIGVEAFAIEPRHVLVFVRQEGKWLCTQHKKRGIEIPGGKVEAGETLAQAAIREVYEETAVVLQDVQPFAHYIVHEEEPFCKVAFIGHVARIEPFTQALETTGRYWLTTEQLFAEPELSFYMKDAGMQKMLEEAMRYE